MLSQQGLIPSLSFLIFHIRSAVDNLTAIGRKERPTIVTHVMRQAPYTCAINVHGVQLQVAIAYGSENNLLAVRRYRCFGVISWRLGEPCQLAIEVRKKDVEILVDRPYVSTRIIGLRWAIGAS